ncbi:hypothetical protein P2H44_20655 [Albimonas sp. CAU 1670]|uniref:hypothetical protein n=1 Tax=Albimonas sp. CAU 1670 TaxID=3032599 RepID=UPI0023DCE835|nr:hypothetical protein [Albimonas sp. CAU 1670]MDF2234978.1 hypothetical protein [Albimonas sp. CAU 1670]
MDASGGTSSAAIEAQARLHHQWLLGLQLMVSTREGPAAVGEWMFRLFRRQHHDKFLSSFAKLGLEGLPPAVACARYHVLSNGVGGVRVEYMEEGPKKAWVRFRHPRWMYDGAVICGIPIEASRGFLRGWYAQNGVSLGNPRLGFVCVSEDMSGQFGLCGYFIEEERDLAEDERLRFAPGERPPPFDPAAQPAPPAEQWSEERLARAGRNYAVEYCRNGVRELAGVLGRARAVELGRLSARLIGLQEYPRLAAAVGGEDAGPHEAAAFLAAIFAGMGDEAQVEIEGERAVIRHDGLRVARGIEGEDRADLLACWTELWRGAVASHRAFIDVEARVEGDGLRWTLSPAA